MISDDQIDDFWNRKKSDAHDDGHRIDSDLDCHYDHLVHGARSGDGLDEKHCVPPL